MNFQQTTKLSETELISEALERLTQFVDDLSRRVDEATFNHEVLAKVWRNSHKAKAIAALENLKGCYNILTIHTPADLKAFDDVLWLSESALAMAQDDEHLYVEWLLEAGEGLLARLEEQQLVSHGALSDSRHVY